MRKAQLLRSKRSLVSKTRRVQRTLLNSWLKVASSQHLRVLRLTLLVLIPIAATTIMH